MENHPRICEILFNYCEKMTNDEYITEVGQFGSGSIRETRIEGQFSGEKFVATPLWLFTHTMTHEFHHKGQIATMGRMKGHIPPDLDLIMTDG